MTEKKSLQDTFAPELTCFGCGPANELGLQIKSFVDGETVIATFHPKSHHQAYEGMINGGIIGALLDCHMNWTACHHLMVRNGLEKPPCTVTAKYSVEFAAPTPSGSPLYLVAKVTEASDRKAIIEATLSADVDSERVITARGIGTFVSVKPGHAAYHRW